MRRVSQQIGWSQESKLYYEVLDQLYKMECLFCGGGNITTTTTTSSSTTTTTTTIPLIPRTCVFSGGPGGGFGGYAVDKTMGDLDPGNPFGTLPYNYLLVDFTINGIQYATGQTLSVTDISQVIFGIGLDGNIYLMNISDWMTSVSVATGAGFTFYDNMRVINTPDVSTVYTIQIRRLPGGGGGQDYYYSSQYGFSLNTLTNTYGVYTCS